MDITRIIKPITSISQENRLQDEKTQNRAINKRFQQKAQMKRNQYHDRQEHISHEKAANFEKNIHSFMDKKPNLMVENFKKGIFIRQNISELYSFATKAGLARKKIDSYVDEIKNSEEDLDKFLEDKTVHNMHKFLTLFVASRTFDSNNQNDSNGDQQQSKHQDDKHLTKKDKINSIIINYYIKNSNYVHNYIESIANAQHDKLNIANIQAQLNSGAISIENREEAISIVTAVYDKYVINNFLPKNMFSIFINDVLQSIVRGLATLFNSLDLSGRESNIQRSHLSDTIRYMKLIIDLMDAVCHKMHIKLNNNINGNYLKAAKDILNFIENKPVAPLSVIDFMKKLNMVLPSESNVKNEVAILCNRLVNFLVDYCLDDSQVNKIKQLRLEELQNKIASTINQKIEHESNDFSSFKKYEDNDRSRA